MAVEIKSIDVNNDAEDVMIRLHQCFGWSLKSSQRVYNKNTRLENRQGDTYAVTETMDFTKLVFERDTAMKNYNRLKMLENQYYNMQNSVPKKAPDYPSSMTLEEWTKRTSPYLLKFDSMNCVGLGVLSLLVWLLMVVIALTVFQTGWDWEFIPLIIPVGLVCLIICFIVKLVILYPINAFVRNQALENSNSKYRGELERQYNAMHREALAYEDLLTMMQTITNEAASLVE